jgi:ATP:corrinoid adenosyltransferase
MCEISSELLQQARELLKHKPPNLIITDIGYLKYHLHIGMVKANQILELLQEVDK